MFKSPVNEFLSKVEALKKAADSLDRDKYWPFSFEHDEAEANCFKREDGLWESKEKHYSGVTYAFIWRTAPKFYCCAGQPCYTADDEARYMKESETEKVLLVRDGFEYVWRWNTFHRPTKNIWGLRQGPTFFELRKDGASLIRVDKKATFQRLVNQYLKG